MAVNYIIKEKTIKNFKRLLLELVAVFAAILLVACGAKSDNGTYVFEPSKEEAVKMLPEELQGLAGDGFNVKISIAIQGIRLITRVKLNLVAIKKKVSMSIKSTKN